MGIFKRLLPSPKELGWSEHNALRMHQFTPYQEGKSWEDWHQHCKQNFPIRYFVAKTAPLWLTRTFVWPWRRVKDWVLDYTVKSRRCHVLDLRGVDPLNSYSHGYLDPCEVFRRAGWACLLRWYREDGQRMVIDENTAEGRLDALMLMGYWTKIRPELDRMLGELNEKLDAIDPTPENREVYEATKNSWLKEYQANEAIEQEMWMKLCAIREYLWG